MKIIHFTDLHYDPFYVVGANANCGEPQCCRASQGPVAATLKGAGYWGDYRSCDLPWHTITSTVRSIAKTHPDAELIYFTGDIVDHAAWMTSPESNLLIQRRVLSLFRQEFGSTPVLPVFGNHESHPIDM